jgi:hypothetical protein
VTPELFLGPHPCNSFSLVTNPKLGLRHSTLGGMDCILGMEFITCNNVFIERHNRLIRIPSKNGIVRMKAHEVPKVGGTTIHLMLGMSQPHFGLSVRMKLTLPKVGTWSPPGLPKIQSSIVGVKTPYIRVFFIPMERS